MSLFGGKRRGRGRADGLWRAGSSRAGQSAAGPDASSEQQPGASGTPRFREGGEVATIGKSIMVRGDLTGNEDLVVEGTVEGKVDLPNNQLTLGANCRVHAEVNAKCVVVVGRVTGNVNGTEKVEVQSTGIVEGDVCAPRLVVAEGGVLNGTIHMSKHSASAEAPTATAPRGEVRQAG